jgi:hypothetical protein
LSPDGTSVVQYRLGACERKPFGCIFVVREHCSITVDACPAFGARPGNASRLALLIISH